MDVSSDSQPAIYALGPREDLRSDDPAAPVKFHAEVGSFEIDMRRTFGHADSPSLSDGSVSAGVVPHGGKKRLVDAMSTAHAVFMVLVFAALLPVGALLPRFADSVKWHGVVQGASLVGGLVGFGMGVSASFRYRRVSPDAPEPVLHRILTRIVPRVHVGPPNHRNHRHDSPHRTIVSPPPSTFPQSTR